LTWLLWVGLVACGSDDKGTVEGTSADVEADVDTDVEADIDTDTDADADSDSDADADTDVDTVSTGDTAAPPTVGSAWSEDGPVLPLPVCPEWYCLGATDPALERDAAGNLVLWFSAGGDESPGGPVLGRALSTDDGASFVPEPNAPIHLAGSGVWDVRRETVSVRFDPAVDRWTSWYLGYAVSFFDDPAIGQAVSTDADGTSFEPSDAPIYRPAPGSWDELFVTGPTMVVGHDGVWRLYYVGAGSTVGVGLLESTDEGTTWTPHPDNPVFERDLAGWDQGILEPEVALIDGRYHLWYAGYEEPLDLATSSMAIGLATSLDGVHWERHPDNPVLEPSGVAGSWNELRVTSPSVLLDDDGTLRMAVHGQSAADAAAGIPLGRIGMYRAAP